MKFTNHDDAANFMVTVCAEKGLFSQEQIEAEVKAVVESIPSATRVMYAPAELQDDNYVLAANFYEVYLGEAGSKQNPANIAVTVGGGTLSTSKGAFVPPTTLTDEQNAAAQALLAGNLEAKAQKTVQTKVAKLLVRAPKASELIGGKKVVPECDADKLAEYEKYLLDTPENKKAFATVKEAVQKKTPMPVFINDASRKYMGVIVATPVLETGKTIMKEIAMDDERLTNFLAIELFCRIPSEATGLGCKISGFKKAKAGKKADVDVTRAQGKAHIVWDGKTTAIKEGDPNLVISINEKKGKEVKDSKVRIAESFKIYATKKSEDGSVEFKTNKKGEKITKSIRLQGKTNEMPVLVRKSDYVELFGEEKMGTVIFATMTQKEKEAALQQALIFVDMTASTRGTGTGNVMLDNILKEIKTRGASGKTEGFVE